MIKVLCKTTGRTWVLPDSEAFSIVHDEWNKDFVIVDGGLTEDDANTVSQEEVQKIEETDEELSDEVPNEAIPQQPKPSLKHVNEEEYLAMDLDLDNASMVELRGYCKRLGIKIKARETRKSMLEKLKQTGIVE